MQRHEDNEQVSGVVIVRPEGSVVYFNADHVRDTVVDRVQGTSPPVRMVVCDLSAAPHVDMAGAEMMKRLEAELQVLGARLRIVEARSKVRDTLRLHGLEERAGTVDRFTSVADAVETAAADKEDGRP